MHPHLLIGARGHTRPSSGGRAATAVSGVCTLAEVSALSAVRMLPAMRGYCVCSIIKCEVGWLSRRRSGGEGSSADKMLVC